MSRKKSLIIVTCPSSGRGFDYVNDILNEVPWTVEVLDTFTSAQGEQIFFLLFAENNLQGMREKVGQLYQIDKYGPGIESVLLEDVLDSTLEALAGLPAASVEGPLVFVESHKIGWVVRSLNQVLSQHAQEIVLGDFEVGIAKGGKASYFFSAPLALAESLVEALRSEYEGVDVAVVKNMHLALKPFFSFADSAQ